MFCDEIAKIEAHESEVLCVEFTPTESGNDMKKFSKYRDATTGFPPKWRQRHERKKIHGRVSTQIWVVLLIGLRKFPGMTKEEHYPDLGNDTSSVWNFCSRSSEVISRGKGQLFHRLYCILQITASTCVETGG